MNGSLPSVYVPRASDGEESRRSTEALLYGFDRTKPVVWTDAAVRDYWVAEWRERVRADQDAVILVWGKAGSGKSTCVLDLAWRIDPTFTPQSLEERIAFRPAHVARIYRTTPVYGVGWVDEAVTSGLLSTDTFSKDQKNIVELVNIIRAQNVVLFVVMPDPSELAKSMRARRADYRIDVLAGDQVGSPHPVGHVGRRVYGRKFFLDDGRWLGFSDDSQANPLRWPDYRTSDEPQHRALWDAYYPLKRRYMKTRVASIEEEMTAREKRRPAHDEDE